VLLVQDESRDPFPLRKERTDPVAAQCHRRARATLTGCELIGYVLDPFGIRQKWKVIELRSNQLSPLRMFPE
jgi:hypothetical protein